MLKMQKETKNFFTCILIMHHHTEKLEFLNFAKKINYLFYHKPLFTRFGAFGLFPIWLHQGKVRRRRIHFTRWIDRVHWKYFLTNFIGRIWKSFSQLGRKIEKIYSGQWWLFLIIKYFLYLLFLFHLSFLQCYTNYWTPYMI